MRFIKQSRRNECGVVALANALIYYGVNVVFPQDRAFLAYILGWKRAGIRIYKYNKFFSRCASNLLPFKVSAIVCRITLKRLREHVSKPSCSAIFTHFTNPASAQMHTSFILSYEENRGFLIFGRSKDETKTWCKDINPLLGNYSSTILLERNLK